LRDNALIEEAFSFNNAVAIIHDFSEVIFNLD